jgi:uncharacterized DUF497 family protein
MDFEWDERKNRSNQRKHRVSFETATLVFEDPRAMSVLDRIEEGEERWQTWGMAGGVLVLLVVHTHREVAGEERTRIVSARKATPRERKMYEENL